MESVNNDLIDRMMLRFAGSKKCRGRFVIEGLNEKKSKVEGKAWTEKEAPDFEAWSQHLNGLTGLGIVAINENNMCHWGAIDHDVYPTDLNDLEQKIKELKLPLVICRTKSGGAHLYLFLAGAVSASIVHSMLYSWAMLLGCSKKVEIFPKQKALNSETASGNWLNMPYFDYSQTTRYCFLENSPLTLQQFLDYADTKQVTYEELLAYNTHETSELEGAPPCLTTLCKEGFPEGTRNNGLFNLGVFAKKKYPDSWKKKLDEFNLKYLDEPLASPEVISLVKSLQKSSAFYKCNDSPINSVCNKEMCKLCKFGIGGKVELGFTLSDLKKLGTTPPIWYIKVNDKEIKIHATEDLMEFYKFRVKCFEELSFLPKKIKQEDWEKEVQNLIKTIELIDAPYDASPSGQLIGLLSDFCTTRGSQTSSKEALLMGKVYSEDDFFIFRGTDFTDYIKNRRFSMKQNEVWACLNDIGGVKGKERLMCRGDSVQVNIWKVRKDILVHSVEGLSRDIDTLTKEISSGF